jgi:hypothetical protein
MRLNGKIGRWGFYTTRWVKALSADDAERQAVEVVRNDAELRPQLLNIIDDQPIIYIEELAEVDEQDVPDIQKGFTFFPGEANA